MQIKFIPNGTRLDVQAAPDGSRAYDEEILFGIFVDSKDDLLFYLECPVLFEREREPQEGDFLRFSFYRGSENYTFEGKIGLIADSFGKKLIHINVISFVEKASRRKMQRIQVSLPATLYKPDPDQKDKPGELSQKLTTFDISGTGLCLLSNEQLDLRDGSDFIVELHLPNSETFTLSAKHVRTGNCPQYVLYRYDHAFVMDYENATGVMYDLTLALFKLKLENRL